MADERSPVAKNPNQEYYDGQPQPGFAPGYAPKQPTYPSGGGYPRSGGYPGGYPGGEGYPGGGYGEPQQQHGDNYSNPAYAGDEDPSVKNFDFTDQSIRRGFVRKVYGILSAQIGVSLAFICLCVFHDGTKLFLAKNPKLLIAPIIVLFVTTIAMTCSKSLRRSYPTNFIFLGLLTLAESFILGAMTSIFPPETVMLAVGAIAVLCIALSLFAFQTKFDFTVLNGFLFVAAIVFMLFGIVAMFWPGKTIHLIYAGVGVLLSSVYLIVDTRMMLEDNHKYSFGPEEYIFAALTLYMDIVEIFIYILQIVSAVIDD